jgi:hypothetical protein
VASHKTAHGVVFKHTTQRCHTGGSHHRQIERQVDVGHKHARAQRLDIVDRAFELFPTKGGALSRRQLLIDK